MLTHAIIIVAATSFSALSFWGIVVTDSRRQQIRLVKDIRSGRVKIFSAGGVIYHQAEVLDGSGFIAARPIHPDGQDKPNFVIIDPRSITRGISLESLGLEKEAESLPSSEITKPVEPAVI